MAPPAPDDQLAEKEYVVVILRLLVDRRRRIQGEAIAVGQRRRQRFVGWRGLQQALRSILRGPPDDARRR